jgi:hypothetical protein
MPDQAPLPSLLALPLNPDDPLEVTLQHLGERYEQVLTHRTETRTMARTNFIHGIVLELGTTWLAQPRNAQAVERSMKIVEALHELAGREEVSHERTEGVDRDV